MRISDMRMKNKAVLIDSSMRISMKLEWFLDEDSMKNQ
jgi:hypothetical protein